MSSDKWGEVGIEIRLKQRLNEEKEKKLIEKLRKVLNEEEIEYVDIGVWKLRPKWEEIDT